MSRRGGVFWFSANICAVILALKALQEKKANDSKLKKVLALVKSACDIIISSNNAAINLPETIAGSKLNDGVIGALGCVSASIVLYNTWPDKQLNK